MSYSYPYNLSYMQPSKQKVTVTVDSKLLAEVNQLTSNRSAAFEEALRLWHTRQLEDQMRKFYQSRSQAEAESEETWAEFGERQLQELEDGL